MKKLKEYFVRKMFENARRAANRPSLKTTCQIRMPASVRKLKAR